MKLPSPWKGLFSYEEGDASRFFGRAAESRDLLALVERDTLSVLYGVSGIGKTSLLQAGLFPLLRRSRVLPVHVRLAHEEDAPRPERQLVAAVEAAAQAGAVAVEAPASAPEEDDLWAHFHRKGRRFWDEQQWPVTPLIVLDQFEELFTLGRENERRRDRSRLFLQSLARLVQNQPPEPIRARLESPDAEGAALALAETYVFEPVPMRVILSLREDYLAELDELRPLLPGIRGNRMRLMPLTRAQALQVVERPAGDLLEKGAAVAIVNAAARQRRGPDVDGADLDDDARVEPAVLSLFCDELYLRAGGTTISPQSVLYAESKILAGFYESAFEVVGQAEREGARRFVEDELVTETGHRDSRDIADAIGRGVVSEGALEALVGRRLLRREQRAGGERRVELIHDVLLPVARTNRLDRRRAAREAELARQAEQARQEKAAAEASERRTRRQLLISRLALAAALVGLVVGAISATIARNAASTARDARNGSARQAAEADFEVAELYLEEGSAGVSAAMAHLTRSLRSWPDFRPSQILLRSELTGRVWNPPIGPPLSHGGRVVAAAFSPDGRRVATGSWDNTARIWDAATGKSLSEPLSHGGWVVAAAFSPDGQRVVTGSADNTARIWDAATGKPLTEPLSHGDWVVAAAFSPDGQRVVTGSADNTARIWDAATGKPLSGPLSHEGWVVAAAFSPDGRRVVTGSWDKTARIWDAATGKPLSEPLSHRGAVVAAAFSPDGRRVVTGSNDKTARIWDAATGKPLSEPLSHGDLVVAAAFSPDGRRVVTGSWDKTARIWDVATGKPLSEPLFHRGAVVAAAFSPDGRRVVTGSWDKTARIWDAATGSPLSEPLSHGDLVAAAAFSPDGRRVVTGSWDKTARIWDAATGSPLSKPLFHGDLVVAAAFSPDGRRVVTGSWDKTARIWDAATGNPLTDSLSHGDRVVAAAFSPDGQRVVTGSYDKTARIWDAATGRPLFEPLSHGGAVVAAAFSPDGRRVVTGSWDKTARIWDAATGNPLSEPLSHGDLVVAAAFSPDSQRVVTGSNDNTARIWDAATGKPLSELLSHRGAVVAVAFSPDGQRVVTGSNDNTARIWDAATGKPLSESLSHGSSVVAAAFSPDGRRVVTGSNDKTARIWDAATGKPLSEPLFHGDLVVAAAFSPDGRRVVTGSDRARIWDATVVEGPSPPWFMEWVDSFVGAKLNERGLIEAEPLRRAIGKGPANDPYQELAKWVVMRGPLRPIWPGVTRTVGEWVDSRLAEGTPSALAEAYDGLPGDPLILAASAEQLATSWARADNDPAASDRTRAIFEAHYAMDHASINSEDSAGNPTPVRPAQVQYRVAKAFRVLGLRAEGLAAATTAHRLDPSQPAYEALQREIATEIKSHPVEATNKGAGSAKTHHQR